MDSAENPQEEIGMETWKRINEPYVYGWFSTQGNRMAEVVRVYEGEWTWFPFADGKQVVTGRRHESTGKSEAIREAKTYLDTGVY